jgi:hypothetical protein
MWKVVMGLLLGAVVLLEVGRGAAPDQAAPIAQVAAGAFNAPAEPAPEPLATELESYRTFVPGLTTDGPALRIALTQYSAFQGGALMVGASRGESGRVLLFGRSYPMIENGSGGLLAIVGIGVADPPGDTVLTVDVTLETGQQERVLYVFTVLQTEWDVDYIIVPPAPPGEVNYFDPAVIVAEQQRLNAIYAGVTDRKWWSPWRLPLDPANSWLTGRFGEQRSINGGPVGGHHGGTDLGALPGTPVLATNDGRVVLAELLAVRGNMVIIDHGGGVFSGYAHMSSLAVSVGDLVAGGQVVGAVGSTGLSTAAHLHWEMSVMGVLVDGLRWLDGSQGF